MGEIIQSFDWLSFAFKLIISIISIAFSISLKILFNQKQELKELIKQQDKNFMDIMARQDQTYKEQIKDLKECVKELYIKCDNIIDHEARLKNIEKKNE